MTTSVLSLIKYAVVLCVVLLFSPAIAVLLRLVYCGVALLYCKLRIDPAEHVWVVAGTASTLMIRPNAATPVPPILHQIWLSPNSTIPTEWQEAHQSCEKHHPTWQRRLWGEAEARAFVAGNFSWFLPTYDSYPYPVQRVDALKFLVLLTYGGVYLDLDIGCRMPLDPLRQYPLVLASTEPVGFANDVIAAAPIHPLIQAAVRDLPSWNKRYGTTYPTVMFSTGPMFLNLLYARRPDLTIGARILPPHLYDGGWASFFDHYTGNSWHAPDSAVIYFLYRHLTAVLVGAGLAVGGLITTGVQACCARRRRWRGTCPCHGGKRVS